MQLWYIHSLNSSLIFEPYEKNSKLAESFTTCTINLMLDNFKNSSVFFIQQKFNESMIDLYLEEEFTIKQILQAERWSLFLQNDFPDEQFEVCEIFHTVSLNQLYFHSSIIILN